MTPANRQRLGMLSKSLANAAKIDAPAAVVMLQIFGWQESLITIASDLHMRPEANGAPPKRKRAGTGKEPR